MSNRNNIEECNIENGIEQINSPSGRKYKTPEGNIYPSSTTIVSILNEDRIKKWEQSVGKQYADHIRQQASDKGSKFHELMENTILYGHQDLPLLNRFNKVYGLIEQQILPHVGDVFAVERRMYSDGFRCAGTSDLIAQWDGANAIIDWKTTKRTKYPSDCVSYWCQLASYAKMAAERYGYIAEKLVLVFNESEHETYYYQQPVLPWIEKFKQIRMQYYKMHGM